MTPQTAPAPVPLQVLTGFLGAGKTTLLNSLLRDAALAETLVIVNEFGEVGLDHLLIETASDGVVLMESGCLCCTIRGELAGELEDLLRRRDNGRIAPFRRVIVETTGLADPVPILNTVLQHPYLSRRFELDGVVTASTPSTASPRWRPMRRRCGRRPSPTASSSRRRTWLTIRAGLTRCATRSPRSIPARSGSTRRAARRRPPR